MHSWRKRFFSRSVGLLAAMLLTALLPAQSAGAATFNVTSANCTGPGSLVQAIADANASPGADVISFSPGLVVQAAGCPSIKPGQQDYFFGDIAESVIFEGNGAKLGGAMEWVTTDGQVSPIEKTCPANQTGTLLTSTTPGFLSVRPGVSVTVKDLSLEQLAAIANLRVGAHLTLESVDAKKIYSPANCNRSAIVVYGDASLTIEGGTFTTLWNWAPPLGPEATAPAIQTDLAAGDASIQGASFTRLSGGVINWQGKAGSTVNIVSTRIDRSGGIVVGGKSTTNIVNSALGTQIAGTPAVADSIVNGSSAPMNIEASTVNFPSAECGRSCAAYGGYHGIVQFGSGPINLRSTAIGAVFPEEKSRGPSQMLMSDQPTPGFTADTQTWIQPVADQGAKALRQITGQPGLLTDPPGLATSPVIPSSFVQWMTPLLGTPAKPGLLIDAIPDAACGGANQLLNPIDATCITKDVFGNDRWDTGNSTRNIGAVQLTLAPHLSVAATGNAKVDLAWNRPPDPPSGAITGYAVLYRLTGSADPLTRVDIAGATTLATTLSGLTNWSSYDFYVVAVNAVGDGPPSNIVAATPQVVPSVPALTANPGDRKVDLSWTLPPGPIDYYLLIYGEKGASNWTAGPALTPPELATTITGLTNGTTYEFELRACNAKGCSQAATATATPVQPPSPWCDTWVTGGPEGIFRGQSGHRVIHIENTGNIDDACTVGSQRWSLTRIREKWGRVHVAYRSGNTNVTAAVMGQAYQTPTLSPGQQERIRVTITVARNGLVGTHKVWLVTATSQADPSTSDTDTFGVRIR